VATRPIKRIKLSELHAPENWKYRAGTFPVIITDLTVRPTTSGARRSWREAKDATWAPEAMLDFFRRSAHPNFDAHVNGIADNVDDFLARGPDENVTQYFQRVMLEGGVQDTQRWKDMARDTPALSPGAHARYLREGQPPPKEDGGARLVDIPYMSTSDSVHGIRQLLSPIGTPRPPQMQATETWLQACLPHSRLQDGWVSGTSWRLLLLGGIGSGSSLHDDHIPTASWQVQLAGGKSWIICPPDRWGLGAREGRGTLDIFAPDYAKDNFPGDFTCQMGTVHAGEMVWYPAKWLHATVNTEPWSVGFTGSEVELANVEAVAAQMEHKINVYPRGAASGGDHPDAAFMPHTTSARQLAPRCFDWWRHGLTGQYTSSRRGVDWVHDHSCTRADRATQVREALRIVRTNAFDDDAELEAIAG